MVRRSRAKRVHYLPVLLASLVGFSFLPRQTAVAQQAWTLPSPWSAQDIGNPTVAGSATFDQGTFTVTAGGADIWGQSDQFTFVYQQVTGDVDVIARIDSITAAHLWSKSGLMIRSSLAANAAHGFALVSAGRGVAFQRRPTDGGMSTSTSGPAAMAPYWVRLVRSGTTVTAYSSTTGTTWSLIGSSRIGLGAIAYVGIATTSHNASSSTTAVLSQVSLTPLSLPAPQQAADIGTPAIKGTSSYRNGVYTEHAGGADIWGTSDQFHFVYQPMTGDGEVVAHVQSIKNSNLWAKTGVMIRETLAANSRHAYALVSAGHGYAFQRRIDAGGLTQHTAGPAAPAPGWVRVVRTGSRIEAFQSNDGSTWTSMGLDAVAMADTVYVGIATTSHNTSVATDAVLDSFKVTQSGSTANQPPTVAITSPSDGSTFTAGNDVVVTAAANDADGTITRVDFFSGTTPIGSATSAPYSATWPKVTAGTYSLTAVAVDNDGASTTSAAVSIRVNPAQNQPPTISLTGPANGATYMAPATISMTATAGDADGTIAKVEFYAGTSLVNTDTAAPYSFTWSAVPTGTYGVRAVAYDNQGATASSPTATVTVNAPANQPPTVSLTAPANGASYVAPATISLTATAGDPDGTVGKVEFYSGETLLNTDATAPYAFSWAPVAAGTYAIRAVAYDDQGASASSATATITVNAAANQPPTVSLTGPANGASYVAPATIALTASAGDADGTIGKVEFYAGATLLNTDTAAPYAFTWSPVAAGTYAIRAVAYDDQGASTSSATATVTVNVAPNQPPTVSLTAPANGDSYIAPATISLTASASDPDGTIARVEFYNGTTLLNSDTTAPYAFSWSSVAAGTYALQAVAYDNAGASTSSAASTITVAGSGTTPGLVGAYALNEGAGPTVADSSGSGPAGAITNATWTAGRYGQALSFAKNGEVNFGDVDLTGSFTVEGWLLTRSLYSGTCGSFVMKVHDYGFEICGGQLYGEVGANNVWTGRVTKVLTSADLNVWKHLALTYDGSAVRMYVDGVLINAATGAHAATNNPLIFGHWWPASEYLDGLVDEVRLYNRALTQNEIQSDMNTPIPADTGNQAPSATLTSPSDGATFTAPASVSLTASATDTDGTVARVEFYSGTTLLNTDTAAPYSFTWSSVAAGTYSIRAVAYDNTGASGSSATSTITVTGANQAPTVTLTSPASGSTFAAPATVTLSANATDGDGTISKVEFYNGATLLNTATAAPYSFTWSSVAAGTYSVKAIAYDNSGASTSSAVSTITVTTATTTPPTAIEFTASVDHATLVMSYELRIYASGADPTTATPIATSDLGKPAPDANNDITVDRAAFFSALAPGNYVAAVAAIGSDGTSISSGVAFQR